MNKTFVKIIILIILLLMIVLGFVFAPRFVPVIGEILPPSETNDEAMEDLNIADVNRYPGEELIGLEAIGQEEESGYPSISSEDGDDISLTEEEEEEEKERPSLVPEAREYYENEDVVAHIVIPGTAIDYLIVHTDNNTFYLYHDLRGNRTSAGTVFLDYLNSPDFSDPNSIIYGHNMRNGTKFHNLRMYRSEEFFEENNLMIVTSAYAVLYYDIFAAFITHINFNYIQIEFDDGEFLDMIKTMKSISYHQTEIEIGEEDKVLALSTCWGPVGTDYRLVVVGRLRRDEE